MKKILLAGAALAVLLAGTANAAYVAQWNNAALNVDAAVPSTNNKGTISRGAGITYAATSNAYNSGNWTVGVETLANDDHVDIAVDTTGFSGIALRFKTQRSSTGPVDSNVYYSTTGAAGPFTLLSSFQAPTSLGPTVVDGSAIAALNNNANVVFRVTGFNASGTGTLRFVDISVTDAGGLPGATDVANVAAALAQPDATEVRITGTVIVGAQTAFASGRNQFTVQDSSGADGQSGITIDDGSNVAGRTVTVGERITNLQGILGTFNGLRQLVPTAALGTAVPGAAPTPLVLTPSVTVLDSIESEVITIHGADIVETGTWTGGTNYTLTAPTGLVVTVIRVGTSSGVLNGPIPDGTFSITGVVGEFNGVGQIFARTNADIVPGASVSDWSIY